MDTQKILIIEDNPISRKVLKLSLESENYHVIEAADGTSALQKAMNNHFDLIIQDLFLPDMDGFTLNQKLRTYPQLSNVPIFALSGFLNPLEDHSKHPGFTLFLLKPIEPSYLLSIVKAHLPVAFAKKASVGEERHILIADDNPIQLKLFSMQLKNLNFEVTTAADGELALREAKRRSPDMIISDILMPNMDGFSLCSEIKRNPKLCNIPVILLTSHYLESEDFELAKKVGASRYLTRTPDVEHLISEVLKILDTKPSFLADIPLKISEDTKEKHTMRAMRQLEQQVKDNAKLSQRCAMLLSQLYLIAGVANTLTNANEEIDEKHSLQEGLYFCLDATGLSKGALYLKKNDNTMELVHQIGFLKEPEDNIKTFFGLSNLIYEIIERNEPFSIPSKNFTDESAINFLNKASVKSALIVPLFSGTICMGILLLGSDQNNLSEDNIREFVRTLGMQFGQSIALSDAFKKLSTSEKRYRQLAEISPDAIFIQQDDKFVYVNSSALKLLNANSTDDLRQNSTYDFFPSDYKKVIKEHLQNIKNETSMSLPEGKIITLSGNTLDIEIVISPFLYQDKPAVYMIMRDITARKKSSLHLEIQYAIAWILAESASLFVATEKILKIICEKLGWDCSSIWAVNRAENTLLCSRAWQSPAIKDINFEEEWRKISFTHGKGLLGLVWKNRKAVWNSKILTDERFLRKETAAKVNLNTAVAFPIVYEDEVLGVIEFFSKEILEHDPDLLLWFESIGHQLGLFLKRKHMEEQILYLAEHDSLTGLSNRNLLEHYLKTALITAKENHEQLAVLFLDLDHFKYVNDSMGHEAGDILLKEIASRFSECLRAGDKISRLGGDEFVIILPNIHEKKELTEIIGRLINKLSDRFFLYDKDFLITVSIGVSFYPENGDTVEGLIKDADIAMYDAKEKGRNTVQFCTREMTSKAENRGILQNDLRKALERNEFTLYYQPKVSTITKKIVGMEALIRWVRPNELLLPESFISAIEKSDLIVPVTEWIIKTALLQNKIWQASNLPPIIISINLSVRNLNQKLLQTMEVILQETQLLPNSFEIEITESVLIDNVHNNISVLRSLKELGFKISIDDFGTGYSSLSYLKRFPIDTIKIDKSFVRNIATDPDDAIIVTAIIAMAHSLGFNVIAEGVEKKSQLKFLTEQGCDEIQGYYFSKPLPQDQATEIIINNDFIDKFN